MKKIVSVIILSVILLGSALSLSGCVLRRQSLDGIKLTKVRFSLDEQLFDDKYDFTFSCRVKNTTDEPLQFNVNFTARYGGIFSNETIHTEKVILAGGEKKDLTYTRIISGNQVYSRSIKIAAVTPVDEQEE